MKVNLIEAKHYTILLLQYNTANVYNYNMLTTLK